VLLGLAVGVLCLVAGVVVAIRQPVIATRLLNAVLPRWKLASGAVMGVREARGDWLTGFELRGFRVMRGDTLLASVDTVRAHYRLTSLLVGHVSVQGLEIDGVLVTAGVADTTRPAASKAPVTIADLMRGRFYAGPPLRIDRFTVRDARYVARPGVPDSGLCLTRIVFVARDIHVGGNTAFRLDTLGAHIVPADGEGGAVDLGLGASLADGRFELRSLSARSEASHIDARGLMSIDGRDSLAEIGLAFEARPFALEDLSALVPGLSLTGRVTLAVDLKGARPDRLSGTVSGDIEGARAGALSFGPSQVDLGLTDGRAVTRLVTVVEGSHIAVDGWIRPFDATPTYDLDARADRLPARIPGAPWWAALAARTDAVVTLGVRGSGYSHPALDVTARAYGATGRIDLDGRLDLTDGIGWTVRRLAVEELDLARVLGDTAVSAINGTLTAEGGGADGRTLRASAALHVDPSRYGAWSIRDADVRARVVGAHLGLTLRVETTAGTLAVDSLNAAWDRVGAFRIAGARFHDVDLARNTGQEALASRLDGNVSVEGRGLSALGASRGSQAGPLAALRDGRLSARFRLELSPSRFRDEPISGALAQGSLAHGAVDLDAALEARDGRLDLEGALRPFDPTPTFAVRRGRFTGVDLGGWTGTPALRTRLNGSVTGGNAPVAGADHGEPSLILRLDRSSVGNTFLDGGEARASWSRGQVGLAAMLRAAGDTVSARGEARFGDGPSHGRLDGSLPLAVIAAFAGRESLATTGSLEGHVAWQGDAPSRLALDGTVTGRGSIDVARLDSLLIRARLANGMLTLDTLAVESNVATVRGAGPVALFDSTATDASDLRVTVTVHDGSPLKALFRADTLAVGSGTVAARLGGTAAARTYEAAGNLRALAWDRVRLLRADASVHGDLDRAWRPTRVEGDATLDRLNAYDLSVDDATMHGTYRDGQADVHLSSAFDEHHGCRVAARSLVDSLGIHLSLDTLVVRADSAAWTLAHPARCDLAHDRVALDSFEVASTGGRITAHGVIDRRGDQSFRLDAEGVGLDMILAWLGRKDSHGTLAGSLSLEGPAAAPSGAGSLRVDLSSGDHAAGMLRTDMAWNGTRLDLGGRFATAGHDSLTWAGHLPLAFSLAARDTGSTASRVRVLEGDVDMRVTASQFPLQAFSIFLNPATVGELGGTLDVDASLKGSSRTLVGSGRIEVSGGVLPLPGLGVNYHDLDLRAAFQGDSLVVHRAHTASGKGTLDATGSIRFVSLARIEPLLHVAARRFAFAQTSDLKVATSADLDVSGTVSQPVVRGKVSVANTNITFTQSDLVAGASTVQLSDADVRMMEETFGYVKAPVPNAGLTLYDASDLDLGVTLEGNCWLRQRVQPQLSVALTGQFRLRKAPHGEPELFGRIEPVPGRGYVEQFARNFDITGGEVVLNGKPKDHTVNIQAQYKPPSSSESDESEVVVHLAVEGTADQLKLTLSSEPAMSDAEIVNFIATGRSRVDPSTSGAQGSTLAKDIGMSQVAGVATSAAQQATGLDVLQVRFDALQGATLVSGNYLNPKLYVGIRQPLQYKDSSSPTSTETYRTRYEVEYGIYRWLVINLQGETSKLRSFFRARYAY
jgi:hypothetical protein